MVFSKSFVMVNSQSYFISHPYVSMLHQLIELWENEFILFLGYRSYFPLTNSLEEWKAISILQPS